LGSPGEGGCPWVVESSRLGSEKRLGQRRARKEMVFPVMTRGSRHKRRKTHSEPLHKRMEGRNNGVGARGAVHGDYVSRGTGCERVGERDFLKRKRLKRC